MAVKTSDLIINYDGLDTLDHDLVYPSSYQNAIYFKGKTYEDAIASVEIVDNDMVITTNSAENRRIIFKDYYKQNGTNSFKYIKTDEFEEEGHLTDIINSGLLVNPEPIYAPQKGTTVTGTVFSDTIDVSVLYYQPTAKALTINANQGNDTITGTGGIDTINAGNGDDLIFVTTGSDVITGGTGYNTVVYSGALDNFGTSLIKLTNTENLLIDLSEYGFSGIEDFRNIVHFNGKNLELSLFNGNVDIFNFVASNGAGVTGSVSAYLGEGAQEQYIDLNYDDIFHFGNEVFTNGSYTGSRFSETIEADNLGVGTNITLGAGFNTVFLNDYTSTADRVTGGNDGNSIIINKDGNKTITTGSGEDYIDIAGSNGTLTVNVGAGHNTVIIDGNSKATVTGGKDVDEITVRNNYSAVTINAGAGENIINITGCTGTTTINTGNDDDAISADSDGIIKVNSGAGSDLVFGGSGNDVINTGTDNDTLVGGLGNDSLTGGAGTDTFVFNSGDGLDTITDAQTGDNILQFTDIYSDGISFYKSANDLVIRYTDDDRVTIKGYFTSNNKIDSLWALDPETGDSKRYSLATMLEERKYTISGSGNIAGTNYSEIIEGSNVKDTINALAGNDVIYALGGNDVVNAGDGNDTVYGGEGNDTLTGGNGDNILIYDEGNFGNDTVNLTKNENLTLDFSMLVAEQGWTIDDFGFGFSGAGNKDVLIATPEGTITINNFGKTDVTTATGSVVLKLDDYNYIDLRDAYYSYYATANYTGNWHNESIDAKDYTGGPDGIKGLTINAGLGDDYIYGSGYNDTLTGGAGNNSIVYDMMYFGTDTVNLTKNENLTIDVAPLFAEQGWTIDDVNFAFTGTGNKDLLIETYGGSIILNNFAKTDVTGPDGNVYLKVSEYEYIDLRDKDYFVYTTANYTGNRLNENIYAIDAPVGRDGKTGVTINAGDGNDTVTGSMYNDTITTGLGNNTVVLSGDFGTDTLRLTKNENLVIDITDYPEYYDIDTLKEITRGHGANLEIQVGDHGTLILPGYATSDVLGTGSITVRTVGGDFSLSADVLKIYVDERDFENGVYNGTRFDEYIDATWVNRNATINAKDGYNTIIATEGYNDVITGGKDGNHITAHNGNKTITTGAGNDYVEIEGSGTHTVNVGAGQNEVIITGAGVTRVTAGVGDDTITVNDNTFATNISAGNGANIVTVNNSTGSNNVTTGTGNDFINVNTSGLTTISSGAGDDNIILTGEYKASRILSGAGNDIVVSGDGNDIITCGAGNDYLNAGAGSNTFYFYNGDGNDTIADTTGLGASDTVIFQSGTIFSADYDDNGNIVLSYGTNYKNSVTLTENGNVKYMQVGNDYSLEFWDYVKTLGTGENIGSTHIGAGSQRFLVLKNYITGQTLTYDIQNMGENVETYSFSYFMNGRIAISGNNLKILAKPGQADDIILLGNNNYIDTGDGDDFVRVGLVVDSDGALMTQSNNNTVLTGDGNDHVTLYGLENTVTLGKGDNSLWSFAELDDNTITGTKPLYTYEYNKNISGSQDGRVEMFSQGSDGGDCRLLALLDNLYKNPFVNTLYEFVNIQNRGGSYLVTFTNYDTQGGTKQNSTTVSADEISNWHNVYGDLDVVVTDIAMNKLISINHDYGMDSIQNAYYNTLGNYLFGRNQITVVNSLALDPLWSMYQNGDINNLVLSLGGERIDELGYITGHQYSVFDVQANYVTLINPWNNMDRLTLERGMLENSVLYVYGEDLLDQGRILPNADGDVLAEYTNTSIDEIRAQLANWVSSNGASGMADIASNTNDNIGVIVPSGVMGNEADIIQQYVA